MESREQKIARLRQMADRMRRNALTMALGAGPAHIGSGLSIIEICAVLYGGVMKSNPLDPFWQERDRFLLSKGHGCLGFYTALAEAGFFPVEELKSFGQPDGFLPGHPTMHLEKGIELSSGSLGLGLSVGVGVALAARKKGRPYTTYVLMGDGECNEGTVWEAAMAASHFKLDKLVAVVDANGIQSDGPCSTIMNMGALEAKWQSFGWEARTAADGHDVAALYDCLTSPRSEPEKPMALIAYTVKGKGVSFMESNNEWHHCRLSQAQYDAAVRELPD